MPDSYVISKERCPHCAKLGKDNSHDNLAIYSDGHKFCFSCKYAEFPNSIESFKRRHTDQLEINVNQICLPVDCDIIYPDRALKWIEQYELTKNDLLNNNVLWSEQMQRLIFPIYGDKGGLIAYQGRSFHTGLPSKKTAKWYGEGNLKDTFNFLGNKQSKILVLTEDVVSAIKVAKCGVMSMPLYGSFISRERFQRLKKLNFTNVLIFLDPDKRKEAIIFGRLGRVCGVTTHVILADSDPKEIPYKELKNLLDNNTHM